MLPCILSCPSHYPVPSPCLCESMLGCSLFKRVSYNQPLGSETFLLNFLTKILWCVCVSQHCYCCLLPQHLLTHNFSLSQCGNLSLGRRHELLECVSPVHLLGCKAGFPPLFGLDGWQQACELADSPVVHLPCISAVRLSGARGCGEGGVWVEDLLLASVKFLVS